MPCSLCNNPGHNRRSAACPVNIANRVGQRPTAELRPRPTQSVSGPGPVGIPTTLPTAPIGPTGIPPQYAGPTGREMNSSNPEYYMPRPDDELNAYILLYKNMRPRSQYEDRRFNITYNIYRLLEIPGQPVIPRHYVSQTDNKVVIRRIGAIYFTAIGVYEGNNIRKLNLCEMPNANDDVCIIIPQIPGFNIPIIVPDVSAKTVFEDHIKQMRYEIHDNDETEPSCENTCALCLDTIKHEHIVHTNCSHTYCAVCFAKYIKSQHTKFKRLSCIPNDIVELPCPLCRTNITKLEFNTPEQHYLMCVFMSDEILPY